MDIIISPASKDPLYLQIKDQIKQLILSGRLKEGDPLPSMRVLAKDLQVSLITTKRAYDELEKEGLIVSTVGRGSFVAGQHAHALTEWQLRALEEQLAQLVEDGKRLGLSEQDFIDMVKICFREGGLG